MPRDRIFYGWWIVAAGFGLEGLIGALMFHAYGSYAAQAPVLHLRRVPGGQLFNFYGRAFERVWATAEPVA